MKYKTSYFFFFSGILVTLQSGYAQSDICCVLSKLNDQNVETMSTVSSSAKCIAGHIINYGMAQGFSVCRAQNDPKNECSTLTSKERCQICQYFWLGETCVKEDPVEKAKKLLEQEENKIKQSTKSHPKTYNKIAPSQ